MSETKDQRVAVIGAGIIGLSSAYRLQQQGFKVTIFDGKGIANGASYGNAGHFATEQVFPLANLGLLTQVPRMLLDPLGPFSIQANYLAKALPWFCRFMLAMRPAQINKHIKAIRALNEVSIGKWSELLQEIDAHEYLIQQGSLLTYENHSRQLERDYQHYRSQGVEVEKLDAFQARELEPGLGDIVSGALYFTAVGHTINPGQLCHKIANAFIALGGEVIERDVDTIASKFKPLVIETNGHRSRSEKHLFDKLVVCAGAHSKALAEQLGYRVPLETERGYHLMLPVARKLNRPIASAERKFIMTSMTDGLRLSGTVEFGGLKNKPDYRRSEMMLAHAQSLLPELGDISLGQLNDNARWMGFRPSLPDSLPIIDTSPHNPNVLFNFGHQHLGLTWAAICAELISELLMKKSPAIDIRPYRISRF